MAANQTLLNRLLKAVFGAGDNSPRKNPGTKATPIDNGLLDDVVQGARDQIPHINAGTPTQWMGPGQPVAPIVPEASGIRGRAFNYPVNVNVRRTPRDGEGISFHQLRNLSENLDLLRIAIETRKDQMEAMEWQIGLKPEIEKHQQAVKRVEAVKKHAEKVKADNAQQQKDFESQQPVDNGDGTFSQPAPLAPKPKDVPEIPELPVQDPRIEEITKFFQYPDQEHDWNTWMRAILEDLLVLDAPTLFPRMTVGGDLYAMELIDGSTIKRVLDDTGRTPLPPDPAYQQIMHGLPAINYTRDELIYRPRNVRTHKMYGYSPVEQIIMTVNIALRRQVHQLQFYTEGNVPEALIGVPTEWSPDQIRLFQEYWDSILEGDTAQRRHAKFVPGGTAYTPTKGESLKDDMDDWLARVICFCFSLPPSALVKQVNRATAETQKDQAQAEGLTPLMKWFKGMMDYIIWKYFGYDDLEFKWVEDEEAAPLAQMQTLTGYTTAKIMTPDEARDKLGMPALTEEQKATLTPPAPPALGQPGAPNAQVPGDGQPPPGGKPGGPVAAQGGTAKPVGKTQAASLRKAVKPLNRNRKSVKECTSGITTLVQTALAAAGKRISRELGEKAGVKEAAISADEKTTRLLSELTFEELQDIAPDLAELLEDMTQEAGEVALAQVLSDIDDSMLDQVNERAVDYAAERSATLIKDLEDSTRDMLRTDLISGIESGATNDDIATALADNYGFSDERAETIARTETAYADVQGNLEGYKASGVVDMKEWSTGGGDTCDECNGLDKVQVPLDDDFPDEGGDGPPLHPNCRCDILPVLADNSAEDDSQSQE